MRAVFFIACVFIFAAAVDALWETKPRPRPKRPVNTRFPAFCRQPAESGPCYAYGPSYYYDMKERTCKRFIYGGCNGNQNRFRTFEECMGKCGLDRNPMDPHKKPGGGIYFRD